MKKTAILFLIFFSVSVYAQTADVLEIVKADRELASGHERPYDFNSKTLTDAPKGYKPFYISHYGRHGSRYAWDKTTYDSIRNALESAKEQDLLTEAGAKLFDSYMRFCDIPTVDFGCLVPQGWDEQKKLGKRMYEHFPEVFTKGGQVFVQASTAQRAVLSMSSFTLALQKAEPGLNIYAEALTSGLSVTKSANPDWSAGPFFERGRNSDRLETRESYVGRKVEWKGILGRLFTSDSFFASDYDKAYFCLQLYYLWSGYRNYCEEPFLEGMFTPEEIANLWEAGNYKDYKATVDDYNMEISRLFSDISTRADKAIGGNGICADLRFGHDVVISMVRLFMNLDGSNVIPETPDDVKFFFHNWRVPMASNIQFVFYRSRKSRDILVKLLFNEEEVLIPELETFCGPYYRWDILKDYLKECSTDKIKQ